MESKLIGEILVYSIIGSFLLLLISLVTIGLSVIFEKNKFLKKIKKFFNL